MNELINSSKLANQISKILHLSQADGLKLYQELSQVPNGVLKDALYTLTQKAGKQQESKMHTYVACIKGSSVRDAQYEKAAGSDHLDDDMWVDAQEIPLFLGIIEANTPTRAAQIMAARNGVDKNVITLFSIN